MQQNLAESLWPLLKPGGKLLYVTCSVLPSENAEQAKHLKKRWPEAVEVDLVARVNDLAGGSQSLKSSGLQQAVSAAGGSPGLQLLPGDSGMDGFYYWLVEKPVD